MSEKYKLSPLPADFLDDADMFNLSELLECTAVRPWILSALGNAVRFSNKFELTEPKKDEKMLYQLWRLMNQLDDKEKRDYYALTSLVVRSAVNKQ